MEFIEFGNKDKDKLKLFVNLTWSIYKNTHSFIPQLNAELLGNKLLGIKGLLTSEHPFHKKASVRYFLALELGVIKGRIAACDNHVFNKGQKQHTIFFSFFECVNDTKISNALLEKVIKWGKERGAKRIMGPVNFDTTDNLGLLLEGFDKHHYLMTAWNHPYYQKLIEDFAYNGEKLTKAMDLIAQEMPVQTPPELVEKRNRLGRIVDKIRKRRGISIERITSKNLNNYVPVLANIYNTAWEKNYGFAPITEEDAEMLKSNLKTIVNQSILLIAFVKGEPAAFFGALADINEMIKRKDNLKDWELIRVLRILYNRTKVKYIRLFAFGILDKFRKIGVDTVIYYEGFKTAQNMKNLETCEISWLLETNSLVIRAGESMGAKFTKRWRVYEMRIV